MTRILKIAMILVLVMLSGCAAQTRVSRIALHISSPGLAGPTGPFELLEPALSPKRISKSGSAKKGAGRSAKAEVKKSAGKVHITVAPPAAMMVPASGDVRTRLVRSARRLVGIRKSFDTRSFIGHLLAICDLLPRGASSMSQKTADIIRRARVSGKFSKGAGGDALKAGDIVFFKCGSSCGADASDGAGAGILIDATEDRQVFIAYVDGVVQKVSGIDQLTGSSSP